MKRWLWTAALVSCAFVAMAQLPRPGEKLPASKVSTVGLPSTDLQSNISAGELCQAPCASGSLADGAVTEPKLAAINGPAGIDEFCLTSEGTGFEWQTCGSGSETNTLTTVTTGIVDDQVPVGSAAGVAQYKTIPNCIAGNVLTYTQSSNTFGCQADAGGTETNTLTTVTTGITADQIPVGTTGGNASTYKNLPNGVVAYNTTTDVLSAAADIAQIESPGSGDQVMISDSTASSSWKSMPTTGTNGCAGAGQALQYNTSTDSLTCITGLATGSGIATVQDVDGSDSQGSLSTLQFDLADGFTIAANGANTARVDIGTLPLARLADNASSGLCLLSGGAGDPAYGTCPGGGITSVGDCTGPACFNGTATSSTLMIKGAAPSIKFDDSDTTSTAEEVITYGFCQSDNNCSYQVMAESGTGETMTGNFTISSIGGNTLVWLGGNAAAGGAPSASALAIDESGNANFVSSGGDVAETGKIRLNNTDSLCWESNPASSTEFCIAGNASEQITATGGLFDLAAVGNPTQGKFSSDGTDWFWDVGSTPNGTHELGEPWVIGKGCVSTNDLGTVNCEEDVNVAGDITVAGVTHMHERILYEFTTAAQSIPDTDDCWALRGDYNSVIDASTADPANRCRQPMPYKAHVTRVCAAFVSGALPASGACIVQFYERTERTTPGPFASVRIDSSTATSDLDAIGNTACVAVDQDLAFPTSIYAQASGSTCAPATNWPEVYFEILGYGID